MDTEQSFNELQASTAALLEACLQFGSELVHAAPVQSSAHEPEASVGVEQEAEVAPLDLLDQSLSAYFAKSFDLRKRSTETRFSVAIIALAKSGATALRKDSRIC